MEVKEHNLIDITVKEKQVILGLLSKYIPGVEVWVYGSRVKFTSVPSSDLDMVIFTKQDQRNQVSDLKEAFEESDLPFRVDLFVWDDVPERFHKNIKENHIVLQSPLYF